ncbi:hypothetical protein [Naasia sp. SYSU D00057]|uniref:hypothetical protein n=1 Tax=Naasia sp. SYSU D00057 TaxID=2817380 RepID=UPI001B3076DC|nr:hypothetical protein [Naasia sp. SYSU D00057]
MSIGTGGPSPVGGPPAPADPSSDAWVPARAEGVQLLGALDGSGYRTPPALVRRADGQVLQLTPLLYALLDAVDGERTVADIAGAVSGALQRSVAPSDVRQLIGSQLLPLGLLRRPDGGEPELKRSDPLLRMRLRVTVTDPERTRRLTAPFARLFTPFIAVPVLLAFAAVCWWVLFERGLAAATRQAFDRPGLLLLVFVLTLLSAGLHEFGHAAAATRGGAAPGAMGAGLYLVWPAFYTDVTDSYRLGRWGRIRTDLGGLYFNAIVAVLIGLVWLLTRDDALLLVVASQVLLMVRQLAPVVRFDGYHVLADTTGVPDLFQRIGPTLRGLLPWRWKDPENRVLKPGARAVITLWVLLVVPLLLLSAVLLVLAFPRIVGTALASLGEQSGMLSAAADAGDAGGMAVRILAMLAIAVPVAGMGYLLIRMVRQLALSAWRRTSGRPVRRGIAALVAAAVVAALAVAWWPAPGTYRPVQAYEDGTVTSAVRALAPGQHQTAVMAAGDTGRQVVLWPEDGPLPTADDPAMSVMLLPRTDGEGRGAGAGAATDAPAPAWVFPFDRPSAPKEGDSQALAVNTEDGTIVYDVAFALVWVEDDIVDTTNEAFAFASCDGCAAVAVGFQVVLVVGQADVAVPQNLAAAVNYNCIDCVSYALAQQLVLTLDGPLSDATLAELQALWQELAEFGAHIADVPLSELEARLTEFKARIAEVIAKDPAAVPAPATGAPATGGGTPSPAPDPSSSPDGSSDPDPDGAGGTEGPEPEAPSDPEPSTQPSSPPAEEGPAPAPEPAPSTPVTPSEPAAEATPAPTAATG